VGENVEDVQAQAVRAAVVPDVRHGHDAPKNGWDGCCAK
jgi:hypothetical protein